MKEFGIPDFKELCDLLIAKRGMPAPDAEAFAHALMDIRESVVEIYDEFLPKLMECLRTDTGDVQDAIWDTGTLSSH